MLLKNSGKGFVGNIVLHNGRGDVDRHCAASGFGSGKEAAFDFLHESDELSGRRSPHSVLHLGLIGDDVGREASTLDDA